MHARRFSKDYFPALILLTSVHKETQHILRHQKYVSAFLTGKSKQGRWPAIINHLAPSQIIHISHRLAVIFQRYPFGDARRIILSDL
jgi:hypothetical protein